MSKIERYLYTILQESAAPNYEGTWAFASSPRKNCGLFVLDSPAHHRSGLEKAGLFPKRVQLGPGRVGWVESEVQAWLQERIRARDCRAPDVVNAS